jgi:hypothetical protein
MKPFSEFLLTEMFDNPRPLTPIAKDHPKFGAIAGAVLASAPDAQNINAYLIDDGKEGILVEFAADGAVEVHHTDEKGGGGYMDPSATTGNPRFVSTMLQRIKHHAIEKQNPVRIIGVGPQFKHYYNITKRLVNRYGATVSEPLPYEHKVLRSKDIKQFIIKGPQPSLPTLPENLNQ